MRPGPESRLQSAVVRFLSVALPDDATYLVIPGGDGRRTQAPGYRPGTPDMLIVYRGQAIFIELKGPRGVVSTSQRDAAYKLMLAGSTTHVCRSVESVEEALRLNGVPLRARSMGIAIIPEEAAARRIA